MLERNGFVGIILMGLLLVGAMPMHAQEMLLGQTLLNTQTQELQERIEALNQRIIELFQARRYQEAIPLAEEALSIVREQLGEHHPDVATRLNDLAVLYDAQGRYADAEPLFQNALSIRREQLGERHPDVVTSLNNLAELYRDQGRYVEADPLYQEALTIIREHREEGHLDVANLLNNLAELYIDQGRYVEAEPLHQEVIATFREQLGERHPNVATSLNNLAGLYEAQGRYVDALAFYQEALKIRREQLGERHPSVADSLNNLALLYQNQGRYVDAAPLYQEALAIFLQQLGERHPSVATNRSNLGSLYLDQGDYAEAEQLYQEVLEIRREQLGENHPDVAASLNNLALLYQKQGRYLEVEPLYQEALAIVREQLQERHPYVAASLNNLAELYREQGRYWEMEPLHEEALAIVREQFGKRHPSVATSLNNLALLYQKQGRYEESEPLVQEALSIVREKLGEQHPYVAASLDNLAELYRVQGRYIDAKPLYEEALSIRREQLGNRHPSVAINLNNLAALYGGQESYKEAESLYEQALVIYREQLGEFHPLVTSSLNNLAVLYNVQGRYGEAEPLYQEALAMERRQSLGERHPSVAFSLNNLAVLYEAQGKSTQAIRTFEEGMDIEEWNLGLNLATLTDVQRQDYAATLLGTTNRAISFSLQSEEAQSLGLTTLLRRKGRLLDAGTNSLQRLRQNLTPADQRTFDEFTAVRQQLATLTFTPPSSWSSEQYRNQLSQLETEADALEKTLAQRSAVFRAETQPVDIAAVQAQIPTNGVLIEYGLYRPFDARAGVSNRFGEPRYAAYLLFPDGNLTAVDLGPADKIDTAVLSLSSALEDASQQIGEIHRRAQILDGLVMGPMRSKLDGVEHLLISPDSTLNKIPFEVLHFDNQYLVEAFEISYLNSGRDLLKFDLIPPSTNPAVIVAAPNYGETGAASKADNRRSVDVDTLTVAPLEYAFREGRALNTLLPQADFLTGRAATESAVKQVSSPRLLHIATHGLFLKDAPRREVSSDTPGESYQVLTENPLLRAMLALEGFNTRSSGEEDGILTALEASSLKLDGTQLVVLSACDTAQGDVVNGEGVYGLRRAFSIAGAESLMMSLWKVEDESTQELMERYYENLLSGMSRSDALRQVQREMIQSGEYTHPYHWAAFVLTGDWRSLEQ